MSEKKYLFLRGGIKIEITERTLGWSLIAYRHPTEDSFYDDLQRTKAEIFSQSKLLFGIDESQYTLVTS